MDYKPCTSRSLRSRSDSIIELNENGVEIFKLNEAELEYQESKLEALPNSPASTIDLTIDEDAETILELDPNSNSDLIMAQIKEKGYAIIPNVVPEHICIEWYDSFKEYYNSNPEFARVHDKFNTHFIEKAFTNYLRMPWEVRTSRYVTDFFKSFWGPKIITDFGSLIYAPKSEKLKRWDWWVHCDQFKSLNCFENVKAQLNLTNNKYNYLTVFENSHKLHQQIPNDTDSNFVRIPEPYFNEKIASGEIKRVEIEGKIGQLILFDARTWHVGCHKNCDEERLVVNLAYSSKNKQRVRNAIKAESCYGIERRQTSGPAHHFTLNPKIPRWSNASLDLIPKQDISDLIPEIKKLI